VSGARGRRACQNAARALRRRGRGSAATRGNEDATGLCTSFAGSRRPSTNRNSTVLSVFSSRFVTVPGHRPPTRAASLQASFRGRFRRGRDHTGDRGEVVSLKADSAGGRAALVDADRGGFIVQAGVAVAGLLPTSWGLLNGSTPGTCVGHEVAEASDT
jgi:hypothetical protein